MDNELTNDATQDDAPAKPEKVFDDKGHLVVKLSQRATATLSELNGQESLTADAHCGNTMSPILTLKMYALMGMRSLTFNGQAFALPSALKLPGCMSRAKALTGRELTKLMEYYGDEFMEDPTGEDLKNE